VARSHRSNEFFASCPRGLEDVLAEELRALRVRGVRPAKAGVAFSGQLEAGLRVCLWSRIASRVLLTLSTVPANTADELYAGVREIPWEQHFGLTGTFAVSVVGVSPALRHTGFAALKVKDAIVDRFRDLTGERPNVDPASPDVRVSVRVFGTRALISIDLSGDALHRRGYREPGVQVEAPMKENLAAAVLAVAGWSEIAAEGGAFVDPLCGSGTLGIEAAMIAGDIAPGILRERWGFTGWLGRDEGAWGALKREAERRAADGRVKIPPIHCFDSDERACDLARRFAARAGLEGAVTVERRDLTELSAPPGAARGLVATNPPYGGRLGQRDSLRQLYGWLHDRLVADFGGWTFAAISGDARLPAGLGIEADRSIDTYNGPIETKVWVFSVPGGGKRRHPDHRPAEVPLDMDEAVPANEEAEKSAAFAPSVPTLRALGAGAEVFANRLRKMARHYDKWARRSGVTCYRVYDADLPDYAVAVDVYNGAGPDADKRWAHIAEYAPPAEIDPERALMRLDDVMEVAPEVLGVAAEDVFMKVRRRQRGSAQYERVSRKGVVGTVAEDGLLFEVNLSDYLDTGLFLDHRITRHLLREMAEGTRFLNLFAYTGTATVYAAAGGAAATTTVDMSATYLEWATRNMARNGLAGPEHSFVRADVIDWLASEVASDRRYELVFLDPPTFSNSRRMDATLDIQRDHVPLIVSAADLLAEEGTLLFSCNRRKFALDALALEDAGLASQEITAETIPKDFERRPGIHACWTIRQAAQ
jgi:23S rRNA (guanine2445-N2)-methyltransferase / 23S rRNA (guanine2069-N7)-methyltransferase